MIIKTLYKYERAKGKYTVAFSIPEGKEYTTIFRIIAEEGELITKDGIDCFDCRDVFSAEGYYEIDIPEEESEVLDDPD